VINWSFGARYLDRVDAILDLVSNSLDQIFFGLDQTAAWPGGKARLLGNESSRP